ncbi:HepA Superfamily II DNA/RNA helicases, SNF2 family [uncultured Caudovirales phage]|uniref:HepA Superfamily II DNA/RNA helicases, SNF2 family n=1 Tax=uncultured Caudovirales phage TaxID=2100421 RepID=A0A6J5KLU2_9CAUD|nr:HepA Superfamily II DNA/RNA helicases, SNF2 family [uncultured Caudovirales phage]
MFTGTLLPYQVEAVEAMVSRKKMLVAYDLGLGKTVLTIAAIEELKESGKIAEPGIIICLSSLKYQWAEQIRKFTDGIANPLVIDGTPKQRQAQYEEALDWGHSLVDYIIINYEQVVNDWEQVSKLSRGFIVCDEATAIKSFRSKRSKHVKKLTSPVKYALTGTPIENGKPEELYSIMQFVDPKVLGRFDLFDKTFIVRNHFGGVERYRNLPTLNTAMSTVSVRKRQQDPDVAPYLPDTIFAEPIRVRFDRAGAKLYNHIASEILEDLDNAIDNYGSSFDLFSHYSGENHNEAANALKGKIMSKLTALRMLCDSSDLFNTSGSGYVDALKESGKLDFLTKSPKSLALKQYVDDFLEQDERNKVVIFTSYVHMVKLLDKSLEQYSPQMYTGEMNAKDKETAKITFQTDSGCRILISSDAGGYGVDLPQANLLINYDLPWNAGLALQRNGRIRRASSTWPSIVIQDFLMEGSIEERQHDMLLQKNLVADAIMDGEGINESGGVELNLGSLKAFLQETMV